MALELARFQMNSVLLRTTSFFLCEFKDHGKLQGNLTVQDEENGLGLVI